MINLTTIEVIHRFLGKTLNPLRHKQKHTLVKADNKQQQEKASKSKEVKTLVLGKNKAKSYTRSTASGKQTKTYITQRVIYLLSLNGRFRGC